MCYSFGGCYCGSREGGLEVGAQGWWCMEVDNPCVCVGGVLRCASGVGVAR